MILTDVCACVLNTPILHITIQMLCTEPFRIPLAGTCDTALFDKTGETCCCGSVLWLVVNRATA